MDPKSDKYIWLIDNLRFTITDTLEYFRYISKVEQVMTFFRYWQQELNSFILAIQSSLNNLVNFVDDFCFMVLVEPFDNIFENGQNT
jgi:hypothetical protein